MFQLEIYVDGVDDATSELDAVGRFAECECCPSLLPCVGDELSIESFVSFNEKPNDFVDNIGLIVYRRKFWMDGTKVHSVSLWVRKLNE